MSTSDSKAKRAYSSSPVMVIEMENGSDLRFPVAENPRLGRGAAAQFSNVEMSPFGLHWPELDEDLPFAGLKRGDFGQRHFAATRVAGKPG
jgi:hypothetical protein